MVLCGTMAFGACSDDDPAGDTHPESADADADRLTGIDDSDEGDEADGNDNHGTYRTLDDVAEQPSDVDEVESGFATAALFEQDYFECTNECNDHVDSVAIITLDVPRSAKYPTFVIRSDKSGYDLSELTAMVETLATT